MEAIAKGYVLRNDDGARQEFTIWQIARDAVELQCDASGSKIVIQVELIAGYEILKAIERKTGCLAKIDYSRSRLTWSGLRPYAVMQHYRQEPRYDGVELNRSSVTVLKVETTACG